MVVKLMESDCAALAEQLVAKFRDKKYTLASAESCTGGLISHLVTNIPGSSEVLIGGCVAYSNAAKESLLAVPGEVIENAGAVSEPCVLAMAQGVRKRFDCDFGIAVSGIAGPGGAREGKPVGTVWLGLAQEQGVDARLFHFEHDRQGNKWASALEALKWLLEVS
jgi:PncC family amidohydrolase